MKTAVLLSLLALLAPALAQAGAAGVGDNVVLSSGTNTAGITNGRLDVGVSSLPLPAGAATEATSVAISTTAAALKARADLLATEQSSIAISTTLAALNAKLPTLTATGTSLHVSGAAAAGAAPSANPLSVSGVDAGGLKRHLLTDSQGRLAVVVAAPAAPAATTPVSSQAQGVVTVAAPVDTVYVITNTKTLTVQQLRGGAMVDFKTGGSAKIEIFYDPLGTGVGMTLLDALYSGGASVIAPELYTAPVGNGIRAIRMRRTTVGASEEVFGRWDGYEQ